MKLILSIAACLLCCLSCTECAAGTSLLAGCRNCQATTAHAVVSAPIVRTAARVVVAPVRVVAAPVRAVRAVARQSGCANGMCGRSSAMSRSVARPFRSRAVSRVRSRR